MNTYAIYGCGGFGREVKPILHRILTRQGAPFKIVWVDDYTPLIGEIVNGCPVISYEELKAEKHVAVVVSYGDPGMRREYCKKLRQDNFDFFSIISDTCMVQDEVVIGEGCIFCDFTIIDSNTVIGDFVHLNTQAAVYHDCIVDDYVTIAPSVGVMGRVHIREAAYIGAGAMIKQGTTAKHFSLGKESVVGMGAIVLKDVADGATVVGNPAAPLGGNRS